MPSPFPDRVPNRHEPLATVAVSAQPCGQVSTDQRDGLAFPLPVERVLTFALAAALVDAALWLLLDLRPTPFGRPFALDPAHYVFHAIYYTTWAHALVALPFALTAYALHKTQRSGALTGLTTLQLSLSSALLVLGAIDRECQRFMGMHVSAEWFRTYASIDQTPDVIWSTLASDRGGAWSSLGCLALCLTFPVLALITARLMPIGFATRGRLVLASLTLLILPTLLWNWIPGGRLRQAKVRPALMLAIRELTPRAPAEHDPKASARAIAAYQTHQQSLDATHSWIFDKQEYPLHRHYTGRRPSEAITQPNFIVLQLETFRAKDMKSMNPGLEGPSPTPFLDALAIASNSAFYRRYYASGIPTVYAFMSIHASLLQHPSKSIPSDATGVNIEGFPVAMRRHGYLTMHFTGSDPDWDSQRVWLDRWYDEVHFDPKHGERDRDVFRAAALRIREAAKGGGPFLAYISSISNHTPFRAPSTSLSERASLSAVQALHQTMHYTDDVVRELYRSLENEPWFDDTIWIITGDHGYDLGDRGEAGGHDNLRHETTWVPLIVHGSDARLPRGEQSVVGSHLDLAPTITELASIWDDHSYMGNSLLNRKANSGEALVLRSGNFAYEDAAGSLFVRAEGSALRYAGSDLTQQHALPGPDATLLATTRALAKAYERSLVFAIDHDRVMPRAAPNEPLAQQLPEL